MGGPGVKEYVSLFFTFAKIGVCTFGGGYAMLPILQRELVDNKGWATEEELADYYAVGQCTPGVIAVNTATFVGYNRMGWLGGTVATLGVVFPCLVIIMAIAAFLSNFMHLDVVVHAFNGVRAGVVALIFSSILKLLNTSLVDGKTRLIYVVVLLAGAVGVWAPMPGGALGQVLGALCSPVFLVVVSGLVGLAIYGKKGGEKA